MMLSPRDVISCEESRFEFGNSIYVSEEEKAASATCVNEAARKHCKTLAVCNLPHTVIKAIEGKQQASLFHQSLVRTIKKVWYRRD